MVEQTYFVCVNFAFYFNCYETGFSARHLTGNVRLQTILGKLGHSLSYTQTMELDTALANFITQSEKPFPPNIVPGTFSTLVWDSIGCTEETPSGGGTSHFTNGIIIQTKSTVLEKGLFAL